MLMLLGDFYSSFHSLQVSIGGICQPEDLEGTICLKKQWMRFDRPYNYCLPFKNFYFHILKVDRFLDMKDCPELITR